MTNNTANLTAARWISRFRFAHTNGAWAIFSGAILGFALCGPTGTRAATISFQDGVNSYSGESDVQIFSGDPTGGYTRPNMDLAEMSADHSRDLVRFDLSSLSPGSTVTGATLTLFVISETGTPTNSLYAINSAEPWAPGSLGGTTTGASWNFNNTGTMTAWAGGPGLSSPNDYGAAIAPNAATPGPITGGSLMTFNLNSAGIAAIQDWINTPGDNSGFFMQQISASSSNASSFAAALFGTAGDRPLLTLTVVPEPASCAMFALGAGVMFLVALRRRRA